MVPTGLIKAVGFINRTSINIFLRAAQSQHKEPALTNRKKHKQSCSEKYLWLVLIKDTLWWLLPEVLVAKKSHTSHSCSGRESVLCLWGAAELLRKLSAAPQRETKALALCEHSNLSTTSPSIRPLHHSHSPVHCLWLCSGTWARLSDCSSQILRSALVLHACSTDIVICCAW